MTKDVMVTIAGFHMAEEDEDTIEMVHIGEYYQRNGTHYLLFEERMEGMSEPVKNRVKFREHYLEVQKRGPVTVNMVFEKGKSQSSTYAIPFGSFLMETHTTEVSIREEEGRIEARAEYALEINGVYCARSEIRVVVQPKESFRL